MISFFWAEGMAGLVYGEKEFDVRKLQGSQDLIYKAKDRYVTAGAVSDSEWAGMCRALNKPEWLEDERFNTAAGRVTNAEARKQLTGDEIAKWHSEELLARFQEEGVPCAPLLDRLELMQHEQIIANGSIERVVHEGFGEVRQARPAAQFDVTTINQLTPAPRLGQHTREVLAGIGYDGNAIDQLIADGVAVADA